MMAKKIRANRLRVGDIFKKSEPYIGTTTFKVIGEMYRNPLYSNEYILPCKVISSTGDYYKKYIGEKYFVHFSPKFGKFKEVPLVENIKRKNLK